VLACALQMTPVPADPAANLGRIAAAAAEARRLGADLLVTPEMGVTGYAIGDDIARLAEPADGPIAARLSETARAHGVAIVAGLPERDGAAVYNSAVLAEPGGGRRLYRKCHLYGPAEKAAFTPSDAPPVPFELGGLRAAMLICYDVEFPEMARAAALAGAELLIVPTALPAGPFSRTASEILVPARAFENLAFVVYAGLCGTERGFAYEGGSAIVGPDGRDLARAGSGEALLVARLDPAAYAASKSENPYLAERRPALYRRLAG
jgi:predicted amidohydrolase